MTLVQMRASVMALGSRLSILNLSKNGPLPAAAASRGLHAFVGGGEGNDRANNGGAEETSNGDSFLSHSQRPVFLQLNRWESSSSSSSSSSAPLSESGTPICNHWSRQWEKDRLAKKRFSNEGRELRSLFTRRTAAELWKGVTSQSTAAAKSGRGKRGKLLRRYDLNRGQTIGVGPASMIMPGLNAPLGERIAKLPEDSEYKERLVELQKQNFKPFKRSQHPLERGWTSARFGGRKIGPPDPIGERTFDEFETYILEFKRVCHMDARCGRKYRYSCVVVTGNGKGLAGVAEAKSDNVQKAQHKAKNRAIMRLQYVKMYNDHTIFHKIYSKVRASHLFIEPRPAGHGIRAYPEHASKVISTICKALGLKDLWMVVEKSEENTQAIVKAFFRALRAQKDIQQLADEMRLNVVEYRRDNDYFPQLIAAPRPEVGPVRHDAEIGTQEYRDLDLVLNEGKTTEFRIYQKPPWTKHCHNYLDKDRWAMYKYRHQDAAKLRRQILYSEDYPSPSVIHFNEEPAEDAA